MSSAIYTGSVVHQRYAPKRHRLSYGVFCLNLDLDELSDLDRRLRLFGHNRPAVFSFHDADHGDPDGNVSLKDWVAQHVQTLGYDTMDLKVEVLCYPRILGYVFNPLTVYFCRNGEGKLLAVLYEVSNTFHERHTYVIDCADREGGTGRDDVSVRHSCDKVFYVSPFLPMDCRYHFVITPPHDTVAVRIMETNADAKVLYAEFEGTRRPLDDAGLLRMFLGYPLMTLKVTVAIHFEAVRLWFKGLKIYSHTAATRRVDSTVVSLKPSQAGRSR